MQHAQLDKLARTLADRLDCEQRELCLQLLRLLARGQPVAPEELAATLHLPRHEVTAALHQLSNTEVDREGNIVGSGLSLVPTPHCFQVNGHALFTWCALDALVYPVILQQAAQVASRCPVTGGMVRLTVTPEGIKDLEPPSAIVSLVLPERAAVCRDVRGTFCHQVHFFSTPEAASLWLAQHPGAFLLSVEDAYQLGRLVAHYRYETPSDKT